MNDNVSFCSTCGRWYMDGEHHCPGGVNNYEQRMRIADAEWRDDNGRPMKNLASSAAW